MKSALRADSSLHIAHCDHEREFCVGHNNLYQYALLKNRSVQQIKFLLAPCPVQMFKGTGKRRNETESEREGEDPTPKEKSERERGRERGERERGGNRCVRYLPIKIDPHKGCGRRERAGGER